MSKAKELLITIDGVTVQAGRKPYDRGYNFGYAAGLKEGARRERRALKRWGNVDLGGNFSRKVIVAQWLAARSKAKPPREGK